MDIPDEPAVSSAWQRVLDRRNNVRRPPKIRRLTAQEYCTEMLRAPIDPEPPPDRLTGEMTDEDSDRFLDAGHGMPSQRAWIYLTMANEQGLLVDRHSEAELLALFNEIGDAAYDEQFSGN